MQRCYELHKCKCIQTNSETFHVSLPIYYTHIMKWKNLWITCSIRTKSNGFLRNWNWSTEYNKLFVENRIFLFNWKEFMRFACVKSKQTISKVQEYSVAAAASSCISRGTFFYNDLCKTRKYFSLSIFHQFVIEIRTSAWMWKEMLSECIFFRPSFNILCWTFQVDLRLDRFMHLPEVFASYLLC